MSGPPDWLVRPVRWGDIDALVALAAELGPGMTTLPANAEAIARKVEHSIRTFAGLATEDSQYILVLEDRPSGRVLGLSGVYPRVGNAHGFFSYKLTRLIQRSVDLGRRYEIELLTLSNDYTGATEVGTLAVLPGLQGSGAGRFLARARYMLIGAFPHLFAPRVMAEMRGWQDEDGTSPFWDAIGARFFGMSFDEADRLSAVQGAGFIADLMPKQPIYTALLPDRAKAAIGRAHAVSARAMAMLVDEGFRYEAHVDVFDGGPQVHALRDEIRTVRRGRGVRIGPAGGDTTPLLVSNVELEDFRVALTSGRSEADRVELDTLAITALDASPDTALRVVPVGRR
jgi:arginine N-succinyltransferase